MAKANAQGNGTALITRKDSQLATLESLADKARGYAEKAHSEATRKRYAQCWAKFNGWCEKQGVRALPADAGTIAAFVTWLADGQRGAGKRGTRYAEGHVMANSSINQMLSAIKYVHRQFGHPLKNTMDDPALQQILHGVRRAIGQSKSIRRVKPIDAKTLRDILEMLRPDVPRDARDAAILAVGFGGCRRRSEVVGLDYLERTTGRGTLSIEDRGVVLRLAVSKTNQAGDEEEYIIPTQHARLLVDTIKNWIELAKIKKGEPIFRGFLASGNCRNPQSGYKGVHWYEHRSGKGQWIAVYTKDGKRKFVGYYDDPREAHLARCKATGEKPQQPFDVVRLLADKRLDDDQIAVIIKKRYADWLRAQMGRKKLRQEDIAAISAKVAEMSSHSMRVGHITTAAELGIPAHQIQLASGHKTPAMISLYTRVSDKVAKSSLKGMGL